ncbi:MAG TPA: site-specific DNA-methyltransferase [Thermoplasmata archaeon]|nr:site-specific DNA-methyltransferase [Thermoplasmata archaeon]
MSESGTPAPFFEGTGAGGSPVGLYAGDCVELLPRLVSPGSVDVVVTSPPYNLGVAYGAYDDRRPREEYLTWVGRFARVIRSALADDGSFFLNVAGSPKDPWLPWDVARAVGEVFQLQNVIHWVKSIAIDPASAGRAHGLTRPLVLGHYKPLKSERYLHGAHEYIFHFTPTGSVRLDRRAAGVPYQDKSNIRRWKGAGEDRRCRGNTWFLPYQTIQWSRRDRPHPASFPPELPERCFRLHGVPRIRLAVDPFVGIGSSAVAASRLGVPFIGIDLDPVYLSAARQRLSTPPDAPAVAGATRPRPSRRTRTRRIK